VICLVAAIETPAKVKAALIWLRLAVSLYAIVITITRLDPGTVMEGVASGFIPLLDALLLVSRLIAVPVYVLEAFKMLPVTAEVIVAVWLNDARLFPLVNTADVDVTCKPLPVPAFWMFKTAPEAVLFCWLMLSKEAESPQFVQVLLKLANDPVKLLAGARTIAEVFQLPEAESDHVIEEILEAKLAPDPVPLGLPRAVWLAPFVALLEPVANTESIAISPPLATTEVLALKLVPLPDAVRATGELVFTLLHTLAVIWDIFVEPLEKLATTVPLVAEGLTNVYILVTSTTPVPIQSPLQKLFTFCCTGEIELPAKVKVGTAKNKVALYS
jgi:hypothetical protein